jgi:hypothetical protein
MPHKPKLNFGPTAPACGGKGHSHSHSSHSSKSSNSCTVPVVDPGAGWGGTGG